MQCSGGGVGSGIVLELVVVLVLCSGGVVGYGVVLIEL